MSFLLSYSGYSLVFATRSAFYVIRGVDKLCGPDGLRAIDWRSMDLID